MDKVDRIIVPFYEVLDDLILLEIISRKTNKRNRAFLLKEVALRYFKEHEADLYNEIKNSVNMRVNNKDGE